MSQQVNLFNPKFEKQTHRVSAATSAQALGVLAAGLLLLTWYGQHRVAGLQREEASVKAQLAQREARRNKVLQDFPPRRKDPALEGQLASAEADRASLRHAADVLARGDLGNTQGYAAYLRTFAQAKVDGVWLTGASIVGAGNDIGLQGAALHEAQVPAYIASLARQDVLKGKTFASLDIGQPEAAAAAAESKPADSVPYVRFSLQSSAAAATGEAAHAAAPALPGGAR